jgi:hypothetical protein
MRIVQHQYRLFDLTRVSMAAGETYSIPAKENDKSIGVLCTVGGTTHAGEDPGVHLPQAGEGLLLNDETTGWSNDAKGHHDLNLFAPTATEWVCVGENGNGRPGLELVNFKGDSELAAGTGVIVVSGSVSLDGVTAGPDAYFRARDGATTLSGSGLAVLVHPVAQGG